MVVSQDAHVRVISIFPSFEPRLHDACREKLMQQQGWKDHLEELARQEVAHGPSRVTLEDLMIKLVPAGKSLIPSPVKEELRVLVQESLRKL
jgi:hypothetical protein